MFLLVLVGFLIAGVVFLYLFIHHIRIQQNTIALEKSLSSLRMQAIKAQTDGELDKADSLYTHALEEAKESKSSMKVIEFLSRLVQVKIQRHKLRQADPLVQEAVKLALSIKNTDASDSNLDVWMDDMANAFYKRGEHSTRDDIKEFCMRHYLDIKLPLEDNYDRFLIGKSNLLQQWLSYNGRETEAAPYANKTFDYLKRIKPADPEILAKPYFTEADGLAQKHEFIKAEAALRHALSVRHKLDNGAYSEDELYLELAKLMEKAEDFARAKAFYYKQLEIEEKLKPNNYLGTRENLLAYLEESTGNLDAAMTLYKKSLDCFDHCQPDKVTANNEFLHPDNQHYAGQVFAMEHLAQIERKNGHNSLASSLQAKAKQIRAHNPHWLVAHPNPDAFYAAHGFFPFQIDFLPTHFSLADIQQN